MPTIILLISSTTCISAAAFNRKVPAKTHTQTYNAAQQTKNNRFDQKLEQDKIVFCAQRFLDAYDIGALLNRYEHDIGNTKSAYQNRKSTNDQARNIVKRQIPYPTGWKSTWFCLMRNYLPARVLIFCIDRIKSLKFAFHIDISKASLYLLQRSVG